MGDYVFKFTDGEIEEISDYCQSLINSCNLHNDENPLFSNIRRSLISIRYSIIKDRGLIYNYEKVWEILQSLNDEIYNMKRGLKYESIY